jgi:redox-sensitive bicupin YhaK (pirin superfamily)
MLVRIPADAHYQFKNRWLWARWHFSFDRYFDPERVNFGALRAYNHDRLEPDSGFPTHPHREMEIVTVVLEGQVTHQDSTGQEITIGAGEVQVMTAGRGIEHAELNRAADPTEFIQIWILPQESHLTPVAHQKRINPAALTDGFLVVASDAARSIGLPLHQDASVAWARLRPGQRAEWSLRAGHRAYLHAVTGGGTVDGLTLMPDDALEATAPAHEPLALALTANRPGDFLLVEVPEL